MASKKKTKEQEPDLFMRIDNPRQFRKELLESSKSVLAMLKQLYETRELRKAKQELAKGLEEDVKELKELLKEFEKRFPKHTREELEKRFPQLIHKPEKQEKKREKKPEQKKQKPSLGNQELDSLSKSIQEIERKLKNI